MGAKATQLFSLLRAIADAANSFEWPEKRSDVQYQRNSALERKKFSKSIAYGATQGYLKKINKNGQTFLSLTSKGELAILIHKFDSVKPSKWDGRWRLVIFDFPEDAHGHRQRDQLRRLLKTGGFKKLQASVFICPYPLNREAIIFLKQARLMPYIRIMKIEEMDDDSDLRKRFGVGL